MFFLFFLDNKKIYVFLTTPVVRKIKFNEFLKMSTIICRERERSADFWHAFWSACVSPKMFVLTQRGRFEKKWTKNQNFLGRKSFLRNYFCFKEISIFQTTIWNSIFQILRGGSGGMCRAARKLYHRRWMLTIWFPDWANSKTFPRPARPSRSRERFEIR